MLIRATRADRNAPSAMWLVLVNRKYSLRPPLPARPIIFLTRLVTFGCVDDIESGIESRSQERFHSLGCCVLKPNLLTTESKHGNLYSSLPECSSFHFL